MTRSCLLAARGSRGSRKKAYRVQWRDQAPIPGLLAEFAVETGGRWESPATPQPAETHSTHSTPCKLPPETPVIPEAHQKKATHKSTHKYHV